MLEYFVVGVICHWFSVVVYKPKSGSPSTSKYAIRLRLVNICISVHEQHTYALKFCSTNRHIRPHLKHGKYGVPCSCRSILMKHHVAYLVPLIRMIPGWWRGRWGQTNSGPLIKCGRSGNRDDRSDLSWGLQWQRQITLVNPQQIKQKRQQMSCYH